MIVLHYRAIPDLRQQVRRATNPSTSPIEPVTAALEAALDPVRAADPEPVGAAPRLDAPAPLMTSVQATSGRRLGPEAPPRPCRAPNGARRHDEAPSVICR